MTSLNSPCSALLKNTKEYTPRDTSSQSRLPFRRFFRLVDQKHLDWTFLRIETQAKLFLQGGEDGWTRNIRPWIRGAGSQSQIRHPRQFEIELAAEAGLVDNGTADPIAETRGKLFHRDVRSLHRDSYCGTVRTDAAIVGLGRGLQLRPILSGKQGVDRTFFRLSMELKMKPLCQERLKHLFHLLVVDASFGFRSYIVSIGPDPGRPAGNLKIPYVIGILDQSQQSLVCNPQQTVRAFGARTAGA